MKTLGLCVLLLGSLVAFCRSGFAVASEEGHIVWVSSRAKDGRFNLWMMNPDGGGKTQVTTTFTQALHPALSPDGLQVAFSTKDSGGPGASTSSSWMGRGSGDSRTSAVLSPIGLLMGNAWSSTRTTMMSQPTRRISGQWASTRPTW